MSAKGFVIDHTGVERKMACLEPDTDKVKSARVFGDPGTGTSLVPRSKYYDQPISPNVAKWIKNQKTSSMCASFASTKAAENSRAKRSFGRNSIRLSPAPIYNAVCGGQDAGSSIIANLEFLRINGTCPSELVDETDWRLQNAKPGYRATMSQFMVEEWLNLPTEEHVASALLEGFDCVIGVDWNEADNQLDNRGYISENPQGDLAGGHALCGLALSVDGSRVGVKCENSWDYTYGFNGRLIVPISRIITRYGAYAIRSMRIADGDLDGIPAI